eukprot:CAMPEP_0174292892 /NCGR_PEP_ID=MMETSP0809-20121228/36802_1 /TAXON_ID=73025 ORGANISM="Eutreptiella gymnastica-like, Strain CCMP1594" /NCGR_SAMPLE_ID=MMETSP0809 /ASSEMBLY_ACC=CAM_ASM_000658 /LENGTH=400 /DNA_ID=CAMNT_0015393261 /DNA_START=28 /DNA_END=1230 /DNA_ORIENTATION=-
MRRCLRQISAPSVRYIATTQSLVEWGLNEEQLMLVHTAKKFAESEIAPFAAEWDEAKHFPIEVFQQAADLGFGGIYVSDPYGTGLGRLEASLIFEQFAWACPTTSAYLTIHNMVCGMIDQFGTDEQKAQWLPDMVAGKKLGSYCLTEPGSGSDSAALKTTAKREGDEYVINGEKVFISGAGATDVYAVMVRTGEPGPKGISCVLIPKDTEGLSFGKNERKMGWNNQPTKQVIFENVRVPISNRLREEGFGFKIAMKGLDGGRINIASCSLGAGQRCLEIAQQYVGDRTQFGAPLAQLQQVQFSIAEMALKVHTSRLLIRQAAQALDAGDPNSNTFCAMAKLHATEECYTAIDTALQMHGGYGYLKDYQVERFLRDTRVHRILEGANEIMKHIVARNLLRD